MRHTFDHEVTTILLDHVSGFEDHYLDLVGIYEGDLDIEILLMEVADLVVDLLVTRRDDVVLEQCAEAIELIARLGGRGEVVVAACFLAELPSAALERLRPLLGERTDELATAVEAHRSEVRAAGAIR
jgi:hypothetical protein